MADPQFSPIYGDALPETSLRKVDEAVVNWLSHLTFRSQRPKVITVWQARQFAATQEIDPDVPNKSAFPLPVVTVAMTSITPAIDRRVVGNIYRLGPETGVDVTSLGLAVGDALTASWEGFLGYHKIVPGSVTITDGTQTMSDDALGGFTGDTTARSEINYETGRFLIEFPANSADGATVSATFKAYDSKIFVGNTREEVYVLPYPIAFDLSYQVDIWTKTQQDMQMIRSSLLSRFGYTDEAFICVDFGPYGEKAIPLVLSRIDDTTDLEPGERHRELRNTVSFTAKAWLFQIPIRTKVIRSANVALIDASSDPVNLSDGSPFMDWYCDIDHYTFSGSPPVITSVQESPDFTPPDRAIAFYGWVDGVLTQTGP